MNLRYLKLTAVFLVACVATNAASALEVRIGSKAFTESVILGEMIAHLARDQGANVRHHKQLGGTRVLWDALLAGEIDIYPEYTGTLTNEIFSNKSLNNEDQLREELYRLGLEMTETIGFNNTYAIGMLDARATTLGVTKISDLRKHPELSFGFGNEFMERGDGWPSLRAHYQLPHTDVVGLDHDLAYRGLKAGDIDAMDVYTTDAAIAFYRLRVLEDDLRHFPVYNAVLVYRDEWGKKAPTIVRAIDRLAGSITEKEMVRVNSRVKLEGLNESDAAAEFISEHFDIVSETQKINWLESLLKNTYEHLKLVGISLSAALVVALPLGIISARRRNIGQIILSIVGIIQTIPSLALFVFMIPLVGIGGPPAILALFLYSLLPIVRNTHAGLTGIPADIIESGRAIGLPSRARLRLIEIPLASATILAGIKTSAVINVGTATLGALIGAGGYGQPILTGIRLDNIGLILSGAVPAAVLALLVQGAFEAAEKSIVPKGLRIKM